MDLFNLSNQVSNELSAILCSFVTLTIPILYRQAGFSISKCTCALKKLTTICLYKVGGMFYKPICGKERNCKPGANQLRLFHSPNCLSVPSPKGDAHPPLPVPPFLLAINYLQSTFAPSDIKHQQNVPIPMSNSKET